MRFPAQLDLNQTSHFLFEVGSLMMTLFGALFAVCALVVGGAYFVGYTTTLGIFAIAVFGLCAVFGSGLLVLSTQVNSSGLTTNPT